MAGFYLFCDESLKRGKFYSNFYGGLLIDKKDFEWVNNLLKSKLQDLNLEGAELKWSSVNNFTLNSYMEIISVLFNLVKDNIIKIRIMFTDNRLSPKSLSKEHHENEYHLL
ncbi:hypothetical protein [Bergeyella sp. RCAD1439]|uniref:hypothetical protein n=1 Tax=Bergeyella anatis TaxID=3113737 RepID=UPI002E195967|nr:hypothetical protein [Bergeyella sp. RCAD1439]